jgi:hypothetical protein
MELARKCYQDLFKKKLSDPSGNDWPGNQIPSPSNWWDDGCAHFAPLIYGGVFPIHRLGV